MQDFKNFDPRQSAMDAARAMLEGAAQSRYGRRHAAPERTPAFVVEVPGDVKNGDLAPTWPWLLPACSACLRENHAEAITSHLPALDGTLFNRVEVAGPGFINLFLNMNWYANVVSGPPMWRAKNTAHRLRQG